ncbi:Na+/H+ antiporter NhaA [Arthrobacter sp. Y-9]|uniref:Na+/H+ antiporter NhaA n=1 Tax=Arthrobacter sp. Y-9 TaxID=3039385 RepID=UPI00241E1C16|nr:Na+/H+ antiporter NhaA [Arthrobacter sp. Y-9]WFR84928.1 Na+/H+ antiporter NhaA [Arthrobacter sp. Y-9]
MHQTSTTRRLIPERLRVTRLLRNETTGGFLLLAATVIALLWANSPWGASYFELRDIQVGPESLHLNLSLGTWAADGLLAVFFFLAGLELKRELLQGELSDPRKALVPVAAAVGGVVVPALLYVLVNAGNPEGLAGWAIPTATDIAFALAVLGVVGSHLPAALRTFLLTLAVVDDLIAIVIIALFYGGALQIGYLLAALLPLAAFAALGRVAGGRWARWWTLLPLALLTWVLVHSSGVHATVAGVLLAFTIPLGRSAAEAPANGLADRLEHGLRPFSAGFAVPLFAFFAAGVALGGFDGVRSAATDSVAVGIVVALVVGKFVGVLGTSFALTRLPGVALDKSVRWLDMVGVALLTGVGFTVSLLVADLSFGGGHGGEGSAHGEHAKVAILAASVIAAVLGAVVLRLRNRHHRRVKERRRPQAG